MIYLISSAIISLLLPLDTLETKANYVLIDTFKKQLLARLNYDKNMRPYFDRDDKFLIASKNFLAKLSMKEKLKTELRKMNIAEARRNFPSKSVESVIHHQLFLKLFSQSVDEANKKVRTAGAKKEFFCFNGGELMPNSNCKCPSNFYGPRCEHEMGEKNDCQQKGCRNGGKCVNYGSSNMCRCPLGFGGSFCEKR